jgi:membrane protein DedA with SNARE-associated domain
MTKIKVFIGKIIWYFVGEYLTNEIEKKLGKQNK